MKLIRYIGVNLRRTIGSTTFWYCVLAVFALCFTAVIGRDENGDDLMVIQMLFRPEDVARNPDYCAWSVFASSGGVWLSMFAPILAAFPFIPTMINSRITQSARFTISRIGKRRYHIGNIISALFSGGLVLVCGYVLFGITVRLLFPTIGTYSEQSAASFLEMQTWSNPAWYGQALLRQQYVLPIFAKLTQMFLFGALNALPALVFAAFVQNPYIVLCMPFFCTYAWSQFNLRLSAMAYADYENINQSLGRFASLTTPNAMRSLLGYGTDTFVVLAIHLGFGLLLSAAFYLIMNRRVDCGE